MASDQEAQQMLTNATTTLGRAGNDLTHQAAALTAIAWGVCAWVAWQVQGKGEA